jgi:hypothetical protein
MTKRDYAIARLAVAISALGSAKDAAEASLTHFIATEEDKDGSIRQEMINDAFIECHNAATALQQSLAMLGEMDDEDLQAGEPGVDDEDEDGDSDDEEVEPQ